MPFWSFTDGTNSSNAIYGSDLRDVTVTNYLDPPLDRCSYSCLAFLTSCELNFQPQPIF